MGDNKQEGYSTVPILAKILLFPEIWAKHPDSVWYARWLDEKYGLDAEKETNTHPALDGSQVYHSAKHVMRASDVASLYPHIVLPKVLEEMQETARSYREKTGRTLSPDLLFTLADIDCTALGRTLYGKFAEENKRP